MKNTTLHIPAAMRQLHLPGEPAFAGTFVDGPRGHVVAADGTAMAMRPFPPGFTLARTLLCPPGTEDLTLDAQAAGQPDAGADWGWDQLQTDPTPAYRVAINARRLAMIAEALEEDGELILTFPRRPTQDFPIHVLRSKPLPDGTRPFGYLMPGYCEEAGMLISGGAEAPAIEPTGPPVVTVSALRQSIEVTFPGKPAKDILAALKAPSMAFRYSGDKGTKRGVPPRTWYGPDNPFTREQVASLFGQPLAAAA